MWALFDFACEGKLLGTSRTFKQQYENPIVRVSANFVPFPLIYYEAAVKGEMSQGQFCCVFIKTVLNVN